MADVFNHTIFYVLLTNVVIFIGHGMCNHECNRNCEYPASPKTCEYVFEATWTYSMSEYCFDCPLNMLDCNQEKCLALNGYSRPIIVTNYTIPGPSIEVCDGDTVRVKLLNNMQDDTSLTIHWYGMHQQNSYWMDGRSMITQCPVAPHSSFIYEFKAEPAGTHWWHADSSFVRDDGMYGTLIVRQAREVQAHIDLYDYDLSEHVIIAGDWKSMPQVSTYIFRESPTKYVTLDDQVFAILVNGKAHVVPFINEDHSLVWTPLSMFEVEYGMTYRFRLISAVFGLCNMRVSIDKHPMTIIALDGAEVTPKDVDSLVVAPGERYDFLLKATADPSYYCIHFSQMDNTECKISGFAALGYMGSNFVDAEPVCEEVIFEENTDTPIYSIMDSFALGHFDTDLKTVDSKYYISLNFTMNIRHGSDRSGRSSDSGLFSRYLMDDITFEFPNTPFSSGIDVDTCRVTDNRDVTRTCIKDNCECTNVLNIQLGEVVEFIVFNTNDVDYSVHLHGYSFRVLAQEYLDIDSYGPNKKYMIEHDREGNLSRVEPEHAVVKDTVNVPNHGYVIIRFKADNPGYWFFNAQTTSHSESGQAMVLQVGNKEQIPQAPSDMPSCGPSDTRKYK